MNARRLLPTLCLAGVLLSTAQTFGQDDPAPEMLLLLGRPTDHSVTVNVLSPADAAVCVEYDGRKSPTQTLKAGVPAEFDLTGLKPNTRYIYRVGTQQGTFQTQRAPGSTFTFGVQGDSHPERVGKMFNDRLYAQTLRNVADDAPDFYVMMGDDFSIERLIERQLLSQSAVDAVYARQRHFLGTLGHSTALFLVNGNHEQAARCNLDGTATNCAVLAGRARTAFFPLPSPDGFYTGDAEPVKGVGLLRDYYAWTWGDALFVVIDPYWHSPVPVDNKTGSREHSNGKGRKRDLSKATLGETQIQWLTKTLSESKARWKFVFAHHVNGTGRGGIECASVGEWGGKIHPLFVKTGVTIFFQGHDHLFARQELDGVIYQSCPNPADNTYTAFNRDAYRSGDVLPNSGHLRVTVAPTNVRVDYVRSFLPGDGTNGATAFTYTVQGDTGGRVP
ncbi:MAG: metallophosphoesterase [Verrucomicrobiota bacterium]|nr:metallophosphoesterase [Verrucomicrobiota bacterium]